MNMKNCLGSIIFGGTLLLAACTTANADTDLEWSHNNNQGEAKNHIAEEINNLKHSPQEAVDRINSLYEGTVVEVELDGDDGVYYYEIEIVNGDIKYDSKVNADNLEVIKLEKGGADSEEALNSVKRIAPEFALDIADGEVDGEITGWELMNDKYEIIVETDDHPVIIEIDAVTADILNKEVKKEEKNQIDGSGGKGENSTDEDDAKEEKSEEPKKDKSSEPKKTDQQDAGDSREKDKSEMAGSKDDREQQEKSEQKEMAGTADENSRQSAAQSQEPDEAADTSGSQEQNSSADNGTGESQQTTDYQNGILTPEAAINIALGQAGGSVLEWEYDDEDFEYEIELISNGLEVEIEINALNGAVLDIDYDD